VTGLLTLLVWILLLHLPISVLRAYIPPALILVFALIWLLLYFYAFLIPGAAFARHDVAAEPGRDAGRWPSAAAEAANWPSREDGIQRGPDLSPPAAKPGPWTKLLAIPGVVAVFLGIFGLSHPLWLPSAGYQAYLSTWHATLVTGFAIYGAIIGWLECGQRGGGRTRRLMQKTLGGALVGAAMAWPRSDDAGLNRGDGGGARPCHPQTGLRLHSQRHHHRRDRYPGDDLQHPRRSVGDALARRPAHRIRPRHALRHPLRYGDAGTVTGSMGRFRLGQVRPAG